MEYIVPKKSQQSRWRSDLYKEEEDNYESFSGLADLDNTGAQAQINKVQGLAKSLDFLLSKICKFYFDFAQ